MLNPVHNRKELWALAKQRGETRKTIGLLAFPQHSTPAESFKKWLSGAAYPDDSEGDAAVRRVIAEKLK
jgi:hypothetical protein